MRFIGSTSIVENRRGRRATAVRAIRAPRARAAARDLWRAARWAAVDVEACYWVRDDGGAAAAATLAVGRGLAARRTAGAVLDDADLWWCGSAHPFRHHRTRKAQRRGAGRSAARGLRAADAGACGGAADAIREDRRDPGENPCDLRHGPTAASGSGSGVARPLRARRTLRVRVRWPGRPMDRGSQALMRGSHSLSSRAGRADGGVC
ncbi:hypothetical protein Ddc_20499 [Ditylenchus destructor]|nr:hypothetical protein Ddc_20499 [Ditylenchus destructor]